jgi:hypothetical protein
VKHQRVGGVERVLGFEILAHTCLIQRDMEDKLSASAFKMKHGLIGKDDVIVSMYPEVVLSWSVHVSLSTLLCLAY